VCAASLVAAALLMCCKDILVKAVVLAVPSSAHR
jgi:hypothetical protein